MPAGPAPGAPFPGPEAVAWSLQPELGPWDQIDRDGP